MAGFRLAFEDEDKNLARILYNAFLTAWEMNWWQNLSSPIVMIPESVSTEPLLPVQVARLNFYISLIRLTRMIGGSVLVAQVPESSEIAAVLLWLPPNVRPSYWTAFKSGWLSAWFSLGFAGIYRLWSFESSLEALWNQCLPPLNYRQTDGAFVQIIGTEPSYAGNGYSASLLGWQIERHKQEMPGTPIFLDTATENGQKVYERLGFRELGRHRVVSGRNDLGFPFEEAVDVKEREAVAQRHLQRIMILEIAGHIG